MRAARCGRCVVMKWRERISAPAVALSSFWQLLFWFWVCLFFCSLPFFLFWPDQTVVTCFTLPPSSQLRRQPSALVAFFPLFVILCFDYNCNSPPTSPSSPHLTSHPLLPPPPPLFSPLSSDSNGLSECSCDSVALRQKVAALWMWGKEKRRRLLPDCPGTKKETLFSFPTWPTRRKKKQKRKEMQDGGKECRGWSGRGNCCWAQCKEVKLFFGGKVWGETCLKGWAEAWKVSQRKAKTN